MRRLLLVALDLLATAADAPKKDAACKAASDCAVQCDCPPADPAVECVKGTCQKTQRQGTAP